MFRFFGRGDRALRRSVPRRSANHAPPKRNAAPSLRPAKYVSFFHRERHLQSEYHRGMRCGFDRFAVLGVHLLHGEGPAAFSGRNHLGALSADRFVSLNEQRRTVRRAVRKCGCEICFFAYVARRTGYVRVKSRRGKVEARCIFAVAHALKLRKPCGIVNIPFAVSRI